VAESGRHCDDGLHVAADATSAPTRGCDQHHVATQQHTHALRHHLAEYF